MHVCNDLLILFMVDRCNVYVVFPLFYLINYLLHLLLAEQGVWSKTNSVLIYFLPTKYFFEFDFEITLTVCAFLLLCESRHMFIVCACVRVCVLCVCCVCVFISLLILIMFGKLTSDYSGKRTKWHWTTMYQRW